MQPERTNRLLIGLLLAMLVLQALTLNRLGGLEERVRRLDNWADTMERELHGRLDRMEHQLQELARAEEWVDVSNPTVEPGSGCNTARVSLEWNLLQWTPGTHSRLLYRLGREGEWQSAAVTAQEGPAHTASLILNVRPEVAAPSIHISSSQGRAVVAQEAASGPGMPPVLYYQIVAEGPAGNRSTGIREIGLGQWLNLFLILDVDIEPENRYAVGVAVKGSPNPCLAVEGGEVRAYAGDRLVETLPLTGDQRERLGATWQSSVELTRLEFVMKYQGGSSILPVHLPRSSEGTP